MKPIQIGLAKYGAAFRIEGDDVIVPANQQLKIIEDGARITLCDPHRAMVIGRTKLFGTKLESPDIRAGIALLTAALCANGETRISHAHQIDRGFFEIEKKLGSVGAKIE